MQQSKPQAQTDLSRLQLQLTKSDQAQDAQVMNHESDKSMLLSWLTFAVQRECYANSGSREDDRCQSPVLRPDRRRPQRAEASSSWGIPKLREWQTRRLFLDCCVDLC